MNDYVELVFIKHFSKTISILSLILAFVSSLVSYQALKRDSGKFALSIYLGSIWERSNDGSRKKTSGNHLCVTITNVGRRPLVATNLGGDYKHELWKVILNWLPFCDFPPLSMVFDVPEFWSLVMTSTGQTNGRIYQEGQYAIATKKLDDPSDDHPLTKSSWKKLKNLYVFDSSGKKHYLRRKDFKRLIKNLKDANLFS